MNFMAISGTSLSEVSGSKCHAIDKTIMFMQVLSEATALGACDNLLIKLHKFQFTLESNIL